MTFENKYDPKQREAEILKFWEENKVFVFDVKTKKPIFSIDTPPPTMSGKMHAGHAFSYTQTDFVARFKRMRGFEVYYPFGTDDNGLPTEKLVQKEKKVNLRKLTRDEAVKVTMDYLEDTRPSFVQDWKNLGISSDFENLRYSTISPYSQKISQQTFIELYKKGLIEQREGPVAWDRVFQTAIAQAELEDVERKAYLNYVKAKIISTENTYMIYATTRPELCFGVVGMSLEDNGDYVKLKVGDEFWITGKTTVEEKFKEFDYEIVEELKGQNLIGENVIIPIVNREVEISHDVAVKADFGTGIAYFCTYGGSEDIEWTVRHKKDPIQVLDKAGRMISTTEKYDGKLAEEARKEIIKDLEEENHLIKKEEKVQNVNVGERSGAEVEFIVSKQWYVNYIDKKEYLFEMAQKFNWKPEFMKSRLENWIKGLNWDWGFSRQRKFGIPIPVWFDEKGKMYLPDEDQLPVDPLKDRPKSAPKDIKLIPEEDVFDTWFTSASTPFLAINLVESEALKKKLFPMNLRPQAHDIINFWLFYTMAKTNLLTGKNPFEDVAVSGWLLDPNGKKMSKSKGNGIEPQEVAQKYSNDALRFLASSSKLGYDLPYQEKEVQTGIKLANKLYNANKFASMLLKDFTKKDRDIDYKNLRTIDKWVLARLQKVIETATKAFENYDYSHAKSSFDLFFMRDVADNYLEIVKQRLWKPEEFGKDECLKAQQTLYNVLYNSLKGLSPIVPFITEDIYQNFYKEFEGEVSIHRTSWPEVQKEFVDEMLVEVGNKFIEVVGTVRKFKAEKQVSMKTELENLVITCSNEVKEFIEDSILDLKAVTSAKNIEFVSGEFDVEIELAKD